jgi:MFS family permease
VGATGAARYGAIPVTTLAATVALEQGERLSLAQAFDGIKDAFGVSDTALGVISASMVLVGVGGGLVFGSIADRRGRTLLLGGAMAIWTLCMGLGALAPTFAILLLTRMGVGAVEANGPAAVSLMADYYPVRARARMMGRYQLGSAVGGLLGVAFAGVLVDAYGWRAAFWMWIPLGVVVTIAVLRLPEPDRGAQDRDFHLDGFVDSAPAIVPDLALPEEVRVGSLHYATASWREVLRELFKIRSMWFGVMSLTISSFLLGALGAWGIEFFKRAHDLSAAQAGAFAPAIGGGAAIGLVGGGALADRLLARGVTNARVYVTAVASVLAALFLLPGILTDSLATAAVLMFLGSLCLTVPVAPSEALVSDVVPAELRGRAASIRSVVRALAALSPLIVGMISDRTDLQTALAVVTPLYAIGGLVMLLAARTYPADLAFVAAEARRTGAARLPDTSVRE